MLPYIINNAGVLVGSACVCVVALFLNGDYAFVLSEFFSVLVAFEYYYRIVFRFPDNVEVESDGSGSAVGPMVGNRCVLVIVCRREVSEVQNTVLLLGGCAQAEHKGRHISSLDSGIWLVERIVDNGARVILVFVGGRDVFRLPSVGGAFVQHIFR